MTWPCEELDAVISCSLPVIPTLVSHLTMGHIDSHVSKLGIDVSHGDMVDKNCVILFFLYLCFLLSTSCHYAPSPCQMIEKHIIWGKYFLFFHFFGLWWLELIYYSCLSSNRETHPCPCFQTWDGCVPRFNDCHESSVSLLLQVQVVWGHFCMFLWWYDLWYCTVRPMMILFTIYLSWHPSNHARRPCPCFSNWGWTSHMVPWLPWNICYSFIYLRPQFPIF
jgi:hypothetical protein